MPNVNGVFTPRGCMKWDFKKRFTELPPAEQLEMIDELCMQLNFMLEVYRRSCASEKSSLRVPEEMPLRIPPPIDDRN